MACSQTFVWAHGMLHHYVMPYQDRCDTMLRYHTVNRAVLMTSQVPLPQGHPAACAWEMVTVTLPVTLSVTLLPPTLPVTLLVTVGLTYGQAPTCVAQQYGKQVCLGSAHRLVFKPISPLMQIWGMGWGSAWGMGCAWVRGCGA